MQKDFREEYTGSDENITIQVTKEGEADASVLHPTSQEKVIFLPDEPALWREKMSGTIEGLVETSCNPGILKLYGDELFVQTSIRSAVGTAKKPFPTRSVSHRVPGRRVRHRGRLSGLGVPQGFPSSG